MDPEQKLNDEHLERQRLNLNKCQYCGNEEFFVPYTEQGWARITSEGEIIDDGHSLDHYEWDNTKAQCANLRCNKPHIWID